MQEVCDFLASTLMELVIANLKENHGWERYQCEAAGPQICHVCDDYFRQHILAYLKQVVGGDELEEAEAMKKAEKLSWVMQGRVGLAAEFAAACVVSKRGEN